MVKKKTLIENKTKNRQKITLLIKIQKEKYLVLDANVCGQTKNKAANNPACFERWVPPGSPTSPQEGLVSTQYYLKMKSLGMMVKKARRFLRGWMLGEVRERAPGRVAPWEPRADRGSALPCSLLRPQASGPPGSG